MWVWNLDGIRIPDVFSYDSFTQSVVGTATYWKAGVTHHFKWWATATPQGYTVVVEDERKLKSTMHGPTYNTFAEVAAAIRRLA